MTAKTLEQEADYLTDNEIENEALRNCDNASLLRVSDFEMGARFAREHYEPPFRSALAATTARNKEIEELRARVKELEGMVPRWCGVQGLDRLCALGWRVTVANWQNKPPMWLMVPPIPLPEKKNGE